ncbi:octopamine receptor beta-2R, partial [Trichinella spiralis]|uniref:octopamine receptor beta-2R n=1 Tax=Trichinella spiralis TaxID=6334 RepID=UPI0001EFE27F
SCGLRHPMKLVPFATRVRMDVKAFPSRPSVPLLTTNSIITSLAELFSTSFRSGHRAQSCSHQFVLDVASQTSVIGYVKRAHFIHYSITLTSSEFDVSSDGPLS